MRPLALLLCVLGCAEWRMPPTFPERAAGRPVVHEQALLGLSPQGDAAAAELVEAAGSEPHLALRIFAGVGPPLLEASADRARIAAPKRRAVAGRPEPDLAAVGAVD